MKIKSKKSNYSNRILNKKYDTIYMNTDSIYCFRNDKNIALNIKTIEISKKYAEGGNNYFEIFDTSADNIYFEGYKNYGDMTIPIDFIKKEDISLNLYNTNNIFLGLKKINITNENKVIQTINIDFTPTNIDIDYYDDFLEIRIRNNKKTIIYRVTLEGKINLIYHWYKFTEDDLDDENNLDIRNVNYKTYSCEELDINTLIVDKNIFKNNSIFDSFGLQTKKDDKVKIKNIRFIDNDDMKLIPFDKTFEIEKILLFSGNRDYLYIKTKDNEVVIFLDNNKSIKCISKKELLKEDDIERVWFRFRTQERINGGVLNPLSIIVKYYKDDRIQIFDLNKNINIDNNFKNNIEMNKDKLRKIDFSLLDYINNGDYLGLFNSINFSDNLLKKIYHIHKEIEELNEKAKNNGLSDNAIKYLKYRGLLEEISKLKLSKIETDVLNELGDNYKKILKK